MTLGTIHVTNVETFDLLKTILKEWELPEELKTPITCIKPYSELMGETHVKFVALRFSTESIGIDFRKLRLGLCEWLASRIPDSIHQILTNDRGKEEFEIFTKDGAMSIRIPLTLSTSATITHHVSLFSSNDMKKCNKKLYEGGYKTSPYLFGASMEIPDPLVLKTKEVVFT